METTRYGAEALARLRDEVARVKEHDPLAPVTVVVPSDGAGVAARRHLARNGAGGPGRVRPGIAGVEITTLRRLAEQIAAPMLAPRRPATGPVVAAAWRRVLAQSPGVFVEVAQHPATVQALAKAHSELRTLTGDELNTLEGIGVTTTTRDLVRLHRRVVSLLSPRWYDERDLLDTAASASGPPVALPAGRVVLYLPQDLTAPEVGFARALAAARDLTVVQGVTFSERGDRAVRSTVAALVGETAAIPTGGTGASDHPDLRPTADSVMHASDADDEVRRVVRDVVQALGTVPAERLAVLYSARDPYARLLHEQLAAAGVRVYGPGSRPVAERAVARTVLELLDLHAADVPRADLFRVLAGAPVRDADGTRVPVTAWERVSREAGIVSGGDWDVRLGAYVGAQRDLAEQVETEPETAWRAERYRRRAKEGAALGAFVARVRRELDAADGAATWADLAARVQALVTSLLGEGADLLRLPPEEQQAAARVVGVLRGLEVLDEVFDDGTAGTDGETDTGPGLALLRQVLEPELTNAVGRVGQTGDGVLVAPVREAVGLDFDLVHVVGLSEDLYPGHLVQDALLPDPARALTDGLRTSQDRLYTALRELLAAFDSATEVVATFPRGDLRSASRRLPSRWLLWSLRRIAGRDDLAATEWESVSDPRVQAVGSYAGELLRTPAPATEQEWRTKAVAARTLPVASDVVLSAATTLLTARESAAFTRFDGDLRGAPGLPDYATGELAIAPTTLEQYASCPHAYFVERVLGVRPLEQPEEVVQVPPAEVGILVHGAYEDLVNHAGESGTLPGAGEPWSPAHRDHFARRISERADELEARGLSGHPRLWHGERDRLLADARAMLTADDAWRVEHDAAVVASEMRFDDVLVGLDGFDDRTDAGPRRQVRLRGSADKVDVGADGTVYVTDIKTGSARTFKGITPDDPFVGGTKLQLPVYALAARDRHGAGTAATHADYWFVRKDPGRIGLPLTDDLLRRYAETLDVLVGSIAVGLFPQRPPEAPDFAWVQCGYCNPDGVGHGVARERWERKRPDPALAGLVALLEPEADA